MSKTIKIIDLLNKIANGEEVAEKIQYGIKKYKYNREMQDYKDEDNYYLFDCISDGAVKAFLNETVEIIEEQEEIDIQSIEKIIDYRTSDDDLYNDNFEDFRGTINELIEAVKQLDKNIKEKQ